MKLPIQAGSPEAVDERKQIINLLFVMLKATYQQFLKGQDESTTKRLWLAHLDEFSAEHIEKAALVVCDRFTKFAPTIGEFKLLIRTFKAAEKVSLPGYMPDHLCRKCRSHRHSQLHIDECCGGHYSR